MRSVCVVRQAERGVVCWRCFMTVLEDHSTYLNRRGYAPPCLSAFTDEEVAVLDRYGHWMAALAAGTIAPVTSEQRRFVEMTRGDVLPETRFERLWAKLCQFRNAAETEKTRVLFERLAGARKVVEVIRARVDAEREAVLATVRAELDALEEKHARELEEASQAAAALESEVKAEVLKAGHSVRI